MTALAMLPAAETRPLFERALSTKTKPSAQPPPKASPACTTRRIAVLEKAFGDERKMPPRLANAFALVALGNTETREFAPLPYLVNTLNSRSYRGVAEAYLTELARNPTVRSALYEYVKRGTKDEKLGIGRVLAVSGDRESVAHLETLSKDPDADVAQESLRAVRTLRARLP